MNERRYWGNAIAVLGVLMVVGAFVVSDGDTGQLMLGLVVGVAMLYGGLAWAKRADAGDEDA